MYFFYFCNSKIIQITAANLLHQNILIILEFDTLLQCLLDAAHFQDFLRLVEY